MAESTNSAKPSFFAAYQPPSPAHDELLGPQGVRPHWTRLNHALTALGGDEFARRWRQAQRSVHENGITYSAYGDPQDQPRPWVLNALPLLIPAAEWRTMQVGLQQRARLLAGLLADLYGSQTMLQKGVLPAEIVYRHPGLQLPYYQLQESPLSFYAADLVHCQDGQWRVLNDRTEAPSGLGFALENRVVISRMLPQSFRECCAERLAPFFLTMRETVRKAAPRSQDNPRVVLLTQSRPHENYLEDAYLARYLGYTLAEGPDLAVRDQQVFLKTLGGLLPIDVILRRPNSDSCDPLEVPGRPQSGAAGLIQAVRSRQVAVLNALGSGLVESPIFQPFMPRLCRELLGEDLLLQGAASWWCGDETSLKYVLEHLDQLQLRRAYRLRGEDRAADANLQTMAPAALRELVQSRPQDFVAQQHLHRSTAPSWREGAIQPAYLALRTYLVADGEDYVAMPGGLARTAPSPEALESSLISGEGSQDAWVLSDSPVEPVTLLPTANDSLRLRRVLTDLPSRAADNLYWLGRQIERVDASARLLRTTVARLTSETGSATLAEMPGLLRAMAAQGHIEPDFSLEGIKDRLPKIEAALPAMVFDFRQHGRLRTAVDETLRIAGNARDRLSTDTWRILLHLDDRFRPPEGAPCDISDLLNITNQLISDLAAFSGMVMESMTRTQAFRFLDMGRRLERAVQLIELLRCCFVHVVSPPSELLEAVLEIADSLMTYRSRYFANLQLAGLLDLLVTDESNPRSLAYQLVALEHHVQRTPPQRSSAGIRRRTTSGDGDLA